MVAASAAGTRAAAGTTRRATAIWRARRRQQMGVNGDRHSGGGRSRRAAGKTRAERLRTHVMAAALPPRRASPAQGPSSPPPTALVLPPSVLASGPARLGPETTRPESPLKADGRQRLQHSLVDKGAIYIGANRVGTATLRARRWPHARLARVAGWHASLVCAGVAAAGGVAAGESSAPRRLASPPAPCPAHEVTCVQEALELLRDGPTARVPRSCLAGSS